jgi:signal transduction histidine kinase
MSDNDGWRIVLIDDEEGIRRVTRITLEDAGYTVYTAENGQNGLALCEETAPQIVITDVRMPVMDGIAVLEQIKQTHPETEVIVATAFGEMDLAIRALQLDASDFITKPLHSDALTIALERAKTRYNDRKQLKDYTIFLEREVEDQARILHQDKMLSLGRLAASVVHEINNPLAGILNYCRLMIRILERGEASADQMEKFMRYLDLVEKETSRCSQIVSSLLTFSRKSPAAFGPVLIADLIQRSILLCRHKLELSNIRIEEALEPDLPEVRGDYNQLQQCLINLVFNAADAMPDGGTLTLSASRSPSSPDICLRVTDTGIGIATRDLPHIFEPFFTTKDEGYGVGLGLSTVYGIVQNHQGSVQVESEKGKGTTFCLRLPIP